METDGELSDSELPHGIPSDAEEEEQNGQNDIGLMVPAFINKLREEARPLLSLSKGVPSPTKQLKENGFDKLKESRAKKRLFRGRQEPPNGVIERRYGYIPNPRWGKSASHSHGRQFVPQGVGDGDRSGVPGVTFRDSQADPAINEESLKECEFPQLGTSFNESRLSPVPEPYIRSKEPKRGKLNQCKGSGAGNSLLERATQSPVLGRRNASPVTSTPVRWGDSALQSSSPGLGHSSLESSYYSAVESVGDSPRSIGNSVRSVGSNSCLDKSIGSNMTHSWSSNNSRRHSKKLAPSPLTATSVRALETNSNEASPTACRPGDSTDFYSMKSNGSWSDVAHGSQNSFPGLQEQHSLGSSKTGSPSPPSDANGNLSGATMWSQMLKFKPSDAFSSLDSNPEAWPPGNGVLPSPVSVSVNSVWGDQSKEIKRAVGHNGNISMSNVSSGPSSPVGQSENTVPHPINDSFRSKDQPIMQQSAHSKEAANYDLGDKPEKQRKNRQRKAKSSGNAQPSSNPMNFSHSPSSSPVPWQPREKRQNFKSKSTGKGPTSHLTLENFITPQKLNGKKNGPKKEKKDILMLENRFVEQIAANPTSPPKKVRPSPIKKISFSKNESFANGLNAAGDADSVLLQDCKKLETLKEYIKTKPKDENKILSKPNIKPKDLNGHEVRKQPLQNTPVFSMNKYFNEEPSETGDAFEEENEDEDEYPNLTKKENVQKFWEDKFALSCDMISPKKSTVRPLDSEDEIAEDEVSGQFLSPLLRKDASTNSVSDEDETAGAVVQADPIKVHHKTVLAKKAQRYCHYFEEHQVPNIAVELYFVVQLLTCTEVDKDILAFIDSHSDGTVFRSVHNGVYFAVKVVRRLRRLFASLGKTYIELLVESQRIKDFSPFLHKYFKQALQKRVEDSLKPILVEHSPFNTEDDGSCSFPDANYAHVFKCQRDNFYAFYRHYHDTNSIYEFKIENQIQYVYDGCTPEQNSMVNLMHLAKLYVDHLVLCCVSQRQENVDVLEMIQSKGVDEKQFTRLYEAFFASTSTNSGTASPLPGFPDHQMFFRDFLETLSSPAFNEHLKNLLVTKILELNSQTFSSVCNLHSAATLEENKTPLRSKAFTGTVLTLCILAKVLGYLTFAPYTSGFQSLSQKQASSLLNMREMTPLPLPLPLLLKQAFDKGHLSLTVPWVVEFLSLMDCMAPQLSIYASLLEKLHNIQRFAWDTLYRGGHTNSGLLIVSCISWLFESPPVPAGFFYSCKSPVERMEDDSSRNVNAFQIDGQKLVSQNLLTSCCPYLEQGQVLMTLFALKQRVPVCDMAVIPLTQVAEDHCENGMNNNSRSQRDMEEMERWLGSSLLPQEKTSSSAGSERKEKNVIDDEVVPAYVLTRLLGMKDTDDLEDMENNLLLSDPLMKSMVENAVDLLCARVAHYTHKTILRLLVFTCKTEVRQHFQDMPNAAMAERIKNQLLTDVNLAASRFSNTAKTSFYQVAERVCQIELPSLLRFLSSEQDKPEYQGFVHIACRMCLLRLNEWSRVQLGPELFRRTITHETKRCARVAGKPLALYPNDYTKKSEEYLSPEITPGFVELEQLSELIDTALSHGVWYINALTPGQRPNSDHMMKLITDFTSCVEKRMITMDFAFYVMSNFLMHLIIQYMVDAPANWTEEAEKAFVQLCVLCKKRKLENDSSTVYLPTGPSGRKHRPGLRMKVKVLNLLSVHTLAWLAKTQIQDETMMVYCRLLFALVVSGLLHVETVCSRLTHSRNNKNLSLLAKTMANRAIVKVLSLLYWSTDWEESNAVEEMSKQLSSQKLTGYKCEQEEVHSEDSMSQKSQLGEPQPLQEHDLSVHESYSHERVIALVIKLWAQTPDGDSYSSQPEESIQTDMISRLEVAFGSVLAEARLEAILIG